MNCPWCGTTVTPGATACSRCEAQIVWDGDTAEFQPPDTDVPVFVARDPAMLPVVESLLEANGIPFVVPGEAIQDVIGLGRAGFGYNTILGPAVVQVPPEHAEAARELIASDKAPSSETPEEEADTPEG